MNVLHCRLKWMWNPRTQCTNKSSMFAWTAKFRDSSWIVLVSAFLSANPDNSKWESHVFSSTKCGNCPSCQAHGSVTQRTTVSCPKAGVRDPSLSPSVLSRWCQHCCETLDNRKTVMLQFTGVCCSHHLVRVSLCSYWLSSQGADSFLQRNWPPQKQAQSVPAFSVKIGWKH